MIPSSSRFPVFSLLPSRVSNSTVLYLLFYHHCNRFSLQGFENYFGCRVATLQCGLFHHQTGFCGILFRPSCRLLIFIPPPYSFLLGEFSQRETDERLTRRRRGYSEHHEEIYGGSNHTSGSGVFNCVGEW
ncbi:hypothetical protein PMAYCL1PPCAC_27483 [Pristionchus mayeri]|uniref:Uncharacterized protein n=1 Tax=Pristionchus mayeri TaxID=1317129 RepID=A0AAN5D5T7_9BILA|nr:hypothetical protein PMAYCL1PPCAC_27483 [Pristionchus mayeri]